ncbi:hypothetical protein M0R45_036943 [Rubus argutus]|uniref:Anthocyanin 5-aromatic acyltransferase n=1 Tax=Rubus argutus TaxID=59490 RepID=A0AAW1W2R4_RUBAR
MKTWASFSRDSFFPTKSILPSYDRTAIVDPSALEGIFLKEWWKRISCQPTIKGTTILESTSMVRATFLVDSTHMERIKNWIVALCNKENESLPVHLSAYVLTCAFVWICLIKSQEKYFNYKCCGQDPNYFGFIAGGLTRLGYSIPSTYVGNCVGFGRSAAIRSELLSEKGIVVAAKAIGNTIKKLDKKIFGGAEKWISDCKVMFESELHVMVSGSPKVDLYETDFGLGRPKKIEDIEIDGMKAIALTESRDVSGGIEVGVVLPKPQMDYFTTFFIEGLNAIP